MPDSTELVKRLLLPANHLLRDALRRHGQAFDDDRPEASDDAEREAPGLAPSAGEPVAAPPPPPSARARTGIHGSNGTAIAASTLQARAHGLAQNDALPSGLPSLRHIEPGAKRDGARPPGSAAPRAIHPPPAPLDRDDAAAADAGQPVADDARTDTPDPAGVERSPGAAVPPAAASQAMPQRLRDEPGRSEGAPPLSRLPHTAVGEAPAPTPPAVPPPVHRLYAVRPSPPSPPPNRDVIPSPLTALAPAAPPRDAEPAGAGTAFMPPAPFPGGQLDMPKHGSASAEDADEVRSPLTDVPGRGAGVAAAAPAGMTSAQPTTSLGYPPVSDDFPPDTPQPRRHVQSPPGFDGAAPASAPASVPVLRTAERVVRAVEPLLDAFAPAFPLPSPAAAEYAAGSEGRSNPDGDRFAAGPPRVSSTLNVSVAVGSTGMPAIDREALREALTDILRESARRHGIDL